MTLIDTAIVLFIVLFLTLITWSKIMGQRVYDTVIEIKDILKSIFT